MPPFPVHAARRNWKDLNEFYNPLGTFDEVLIASVGEDSDGAPYQHGRLRIFPVHARTLRPWHYLAGERVAGYLSAAARQVLQIAREHGVSLIVQRYGGPLFHGLPAVWVARQLGVPSIITVQNDFDSSLRWDSSGVSRMRRQLAGVRLWPWLFDRAAAVWTVSDFLSRDAVRRGAHAERVVRIYNKDTIHSYRSPPEAGETERLFLELNMPADFQSAEILLSVGRLIEQKNYPRMLRAFAEVHRHHPNLKYVIVGQGHLRTALRRQIDALGLAGAVFMVTGYLNAPQLRILYHRALALLFCSNSEGQGRTPVEAIACGTPVVGADREPTPELIADGENGLLADPDSVPAMADAIRRLVSEPPLAAGMRDACLRAAQRFDIDVINPQEAALYERVLAGAPAGRVPEQEDRSLERSAGNRTRSGDGGET